MIYNHKLWQRCQPRKSWNCLCGYITPLEDSKRPIFAICIPTGAKKKFRKKYEGYSSMPDLEYVIIRKLQYYQEGKSSKHLTDIQNMLEISSDLIDHDILRKFIRQYNLQDEWDKA